MFATVLSFARNLPYDSVVCRLLFSLSCGCLLLTFTVLPTQVSAQTTSDETDEVLRFDTDLLLFPVRVRQKSSPAVSALTEKQLSLTDKDGAVSGLYFAQGVDRVALVFALDQSGSVREIIAQQRDAALGLFGKFSSQSSVAVLRFSATPTLVAPFGRDESVARQAFSFPASSNQPTAIFDAAVAAIRHFDILPRVRSERRIVILISDGIDNASRAKADTVIDAAIANRVSLYVIHLPLFTPIDDRLDVRPPSPGFKKLAEATGGKYFLVGNAKTALQLNRTTDLNPVFTSIEEDLKSQFLIGFYISSSARDGREHKFSLTLPDGYEYQVWNRKYARKQNFFVLRPKETTNRQ